MDNDFWIERWAKHEIGFHQQQVNAYLRNCWPQLGVPREATTFVPLCGKTLDMRWLRPLDVDSVASSVERTGALVVVHEAHQFAGLGAELVTAVAERSLLGTRSPVRIATPDTRIPAAPELLKAVIPGVDTIVDRIRAMFRSPVSIR